MSTARFILRKDKVKVKTNKYPLYLLITEGKKNTQKSIGIDLSLEEWDEKKEKVRSKHPNSSKLNILLAKVLSEVEEVKIDLDGGRGIGKNYKKNKKSGAKFNYFEYFKEYVESLEINHQINSAKKAQSAYNLLKEFNKSENLTFQEFNVDYFKTLNTYLIKKQQKPNTIYSYMKIYKRIFKQALREGKILLKDDSSRLYKITWEKVNTEFLTEDQLIELEKLSFVKGSSLDLHRDLFIFASYAGGIRIGDLLQLQWNNYNNDSNKLSFVARKNNFKVSFKLPKKAIAVINKYKTDKTEGYIFPLLTKDYLFKKPDLIEKKISSVNAAINSNLKIIAKKTSINFNCHFHLSRHSFGCLAYSKKIGLMEIKEIMGHEDIKSTMIYAKLMEQAVSTEMLKMDY
jgi:integrase/recombinase XerD